jgi:hypothetical protein
MIFYITTKNESPLRAIELRDFLKEGIFLPDDTNFAHFSWQRITQERE